MNAPACGALPDEPSINVSVAISKIPLPLVLNLINLSVVPWASTISNPVPMYCCGAEPDSVAPIVLPIEPLYIKNPPLLLSIACLNPW